MGIAILAFLMLTVPQISSNIDHIETVRRVDIIGSLDRITDKDLRDASSSIEEGKVYTPEGLDIAISKINKLGMFREVTRSDCKVTRSSVHPGTVDVEIRLKLKAPVGSRSEKPK
jgi:hypothetical protein